MTESVTVEVSKGLQNLASRKKLCPKLIKEINDFCWLWPAFERRILEQLCGGEPTDGDELKTSYFRCLDKHPNNGEITTTESNAHIFFRKRYVEENECSTKLSGLAPRENDKRCVKLLKSEDKKEIKTALKFVVFRIRNNLFHGNKAGNGIEPDELELFKHANALLLEWTKALEST